MNRIPSWCPGVVVVLLAIVLSAGCRHHIPPPPTSPPIGPTRWILAAAALDSDQFCVPSGDVFPWRCTSVEEIRRHVRALLSADE